MEREHRTGVTTFYAPGEWGDQYALSAEASHHASVKRLVEGDEVFLSSGSGRIARGVIQETSRKSTLVEVDHSSMEQVVRDHHIELWAPVGDKDRTLWLAEKAAELGVAVWQPVIFARSKSVVPRGEGTAFLEKVRARHIAALEQSGAAWLPEVRPELSVSTALDTSRGGDALRLVLDAAGESLGRGLRPTVSTVIALGPEGGITPEERSQFEASGWRFVSLGRNILRFETAGVAAISAVRTLQS